MATRKRIKKTFLGEFSKVALIAIFLVGVYTIFEYYECVKLGYEVDSAVAVAGITEIVVPFLGYCAYQLGMKNSLNKNGLAIKNNQVYRINQKADDSDEKPID